MDRKVLVAPACAARRKKDGGKKGWRGLTCVDGGALQGRRTV
jgi:hypothetical protein